MFRTALCRLNILILDAQEVDSDNNNNNKTLQ
jgi:hypothetical protein